MSILIYIFVFSLFSLKFVYIVEPALTIPNLLLVLLGIIFLLNKNRYKFISLNDLTKKIILVSMVIIIYRFVSDLLLHDFTFIESTLDLLRHSLPVVTLYIFEKVNVDIKKVLYALILAVSLQNIFAFIQLDNPSFTVNNVLAPLSFMGSADYTEEMIIKLGRVTGTSNISVPYGLFLGTFIFLFFLGYLKTKKKYFLILIMVNFIFIFFTKTFSAIFGIILSIGTAFLLRNGVNLKGFVYSFSIFILVLFSYFVIQEQFHDLLDRGEAEVQGNTIVKISSNIYAGYYTLTTNPLFGIPRDDVYKALVGTTLSLPYTLRSSHDTTFHNMFNRYLVTYGLVGFFLLLYLIYLFFKKIYRKKDPLIRYTLLGIFIYFIQYNLFHNPEFFTYMYPWFLLTLGDETSHDLSYNERIQ